MSDHDSELEQFLAMLPRLLDDHIQPEQPIDDPAVLAPLRKALDESGVSDLAVETAEVDNPLQWLSATVSRVAAASPSLALALASRYTGQRVLLRRDGASASTSIAAGAVNPATVDDDDAFHETVSVSTVFDPELVLLLDLTRRRGIVADRSDTVEAKRRARTGLADARLQPVQLSGAPRLTLDAPEVDTAIREWTVLTSAVALGIAESARDISEAYAADRQQFGAPLTSFSALRAMLAEMHVKAAGVRALMDRALTAGDNDTVQYVELWCAAAPVAVDVSLNAIQVHGGYGYIDEYPVAGLLRDAISVRAVGGARRTAVAAVATSRLGTTA